MNFFPDKQVTVTHLSYFLADRGIGYENICQRPEKKNSGSSLIRI